MSGSASPGVLPPDARLSPVDWRRRHRRASTLEVKIPRIAEEEKVIVTPCLACCLV
jgi:hypothetical protein